MRWFRKKRKLIPDRSDVPLAAYVERIEPKVWLGHELSRKLKTSDDFYDAKELEAQVVCDNGGGKYRCKVFESGNTANYIGIHRFTIGGDPLIDGKPIEPIKVEVSSVASEPEIPSVRIVIEMGDGWTEMIEMVGKLLNAAGRNG